MYTLNLPLFLCSASLSLSSTQDSQFWQEQFQFYQHRQFNYRLSNLTTDHPSLDLSSLSDISNNASRTSNNYSSSFRQFLPSEESVVSFRSLYVYTFGIYPCFNNSNLYLIISSLAMPCIAFSLFSSSTLLNCILCIHLTLITSVHHLPFILDCFHSNVYTLNKPKYFPRAYAILYLILPMLSLSLTHTLRTRYLIT